MGQLYFKIKSDWSEVVRLRQEIARLENQLNQFNGKASLNVINKLCDELSSAKRRMQSLLDDAAIAGKQLEKTMQKPIKIDLSTSEGQLKAFDEQVIRMCSNLDTYFNSLKSRIRELQSLMGDGQTITANVKINEENAHRIEEIKRQNAELQEQIKQQTAEIERQQTQWQQLAEAVRNNNVSAIRQLSQQTDEATRRLRMDAAKGSLSGIKVELDELAERMSVTEGKAEGLKAILDELRNRQSSGDASVTDDKIAETEILYQKASKELANMKSEYNSMSAEQKKYVDQLKSANGQHTRMRTEIMDAREQMAQLIAAGQTGTPAFRQLAEQAATMRKQMNLANATMQYFANPTRHLDGLKTALQGVAGSASLVTGIMGVFNTNSEKMAEIQTKIQSYLGIIVGLESTYAAVKKTSTALLLVEEIRTAALAKAKQLEASSTIAATVAQKAFNAVAKANPYVLLATCIISVVGAIATYIKFSKDAEEADKKRKEAVESMKRVEEAYYSSYNTNIASAISSYRQLQSAYRSMKDEHERLEWIKANRTEIEKLGVAVNDTNDADNVFIQKSDDFVRILINRAKAAAYATQMQKAYEEQLSKSYHAGDKVDKKIGDSYGLSTFKSSHEYDGNYILSQEQAEYLNRQLLNDVDKNVNQYTDKINELQAEIAEIQKQGNFKTPTSDGKTSTKGISPDEILKRQLLQQQEAARIQHQNQLLQEQAVIDQMDDGAEKELAQMRLNHKKRMAELDNEQQDILNKKIEAASKDKKGNAINGFYSNGLYKNVQLTDEDLLGVNSQRVSETEAYADKLADLFKKITTSSESAEKRMELMRKAYDDFVADINMYAEQVKTPATATGGEQVDATQKTLDDIKKLYQKSQDELYREQLSHLYDYLREFGTIQEQIYAIEKQYDDKIAAEKDENIKKQLQKQKEAAMAGRNAQNLAMNIDWSVAFAGVGNVLKDIAKETLAQVEAYMQKPEFKRLSAADKKSYVDLRNNLRDETGAGATSPFNFKIWGTIQKNVQDYQESVRKLKAAQEAHNAAIQNMKDAEAQYTEAVQSGSEDMIKSAKDVLDAAKDAVNVTGEDQDNAQADSDRARQNLTDNTNAAAKGIQNFTNYLNEMSNGSLYGFANGITKLITSLGKGSDGVGKALGELGGKIGGIVGAILQILDALGDDPAQFIQDLLDKVANVVDKLLSTLLSEVVPAILEGVVNIIGSVIEGVGNMITFGGLGSIFGNHEQEYKDGLKSWEQKIAANTYAVEQLTKSMTDKSKTPQDAQKERDAALSALQGQISSLRGTAHYVADDSSSNIFSGYHSWYWKRNDEGFDYNRFNEVLAQHGSDTRVNEAHDVVNRLSAKDIQILRTYAGDAWADYFGYVDSERDPNEVKKYLEEIGDLAEKDKEIMDDWYASLTNMTFESLRDNFKSMLKDLSKDRDSFLSDFSDKMMDSLLDTMMSTSGLSQRLKEWQTKWGDYIASGNELSTEEVTALREEYQKLIDEGLAMRDEAARVTGYDEYQNTKQEADKKGFQAMSQDTGEELNGRFTAVQIAGENVSAQMNVAVPILTGIGVSASRTADMVDGIGRVADDMLTNIVECYTELNLIRINTEDLVEIGKKHTTSLQKIADSVKHL